MAPPLAGEDAFAVLQDRLTQAAAGRAHVVTVSGPPGIGKSHLLRRLAKVANETALVLTCSPHPAQRGVAFAGLVHLLQRARPWMRRLPEPYRRVLGAVLRGGGIGADPLAVGVAVHAVLATAAADRPVLMLVDDLPWLDDASQPALSFAVQRLEADSVLTVGATDQAASPLGGESIVLAGMDDDAARALLRTTSPDLITAVAERIIADADGLPLALVDMARALTPAQRSGRAPLPRFLDAGPVLRHEQFHRVTALPPSAQQALCVVALDRLSTGELLDALGRLGLDEHALTPAERAGLVAWDGDRVDVSHPTLRGVVVDAVGIAPRLRAHQVLAQVVAPDPSRAAHHLELVTAGADELVAQTSIAAAEAAEARGALPVAGQHWHAAARRQHGSSARASLLRAAQAYFRAGTGEALMDALSALEHDPSSGPEERAHALALRLASGSEVADPRVLQARLEDLSPVLPSSESSRLWTLYGLVLGMCGYLVEAVEAVDRAAALHPDLDPAARFTADGLRLLAGRPGAGELIVQHAHQLTAEDTVLQADLPVSPAVTHLAWLDAAPTALRLLLPQRQRLEQQLRPTALALSWAQEAVVLEILGRWDAADAAFSRTRELAHTTTLLALAPMRVRQARIFAARGQRERVEALLADESITAAATTPMYQYLVHSARGLLELGAGDPGRALEHLQAAEKQRQSMSLQEWAFGDHLGDLYEAAHRLDRRAEAREMLEEARRDAAATGRASTLAVVARCTALDTGSDEDFEKAVQHHQEAPRAFEMARTYLAWGQARRRNRRKNAARDPLHQARDIFTRLQAQPWIERTEQELAACGERRPATTTAPLARLTPREVDVVLHAAHDATNAEIAAQLYLSRRTVEYHLANAYQKLGIASRRELAALLENAGHDSDPPGTPR